MRVAERSSKTTRGSAESYVSKISRIGDEVIDTLNPAIGLYSKIPGARIALKRPVVTRFVFDMYNFGTFSRQAFFIATFFENGIRIERVHDDVHGIVLAGDGYEIVVKNSASAFATLLVAGFEASAVSDDTLRLERSKSLITTLEMAREAVSSGVRIPVFGSNLPHRVSVILLVPVAESDGVTFTGVEYEKEVSRSEREERTFRRVNLVVKGNMGYHIHTLGVRSDEERDSHPSNRMGKWELGIADEELHAVLPILDEAAKALELLPHVTREFAMYYTVLYYIAEAREALGI